MRCAHCGFDNPAGMKFCGSCAAALRNGCPRCGFENPPGFKFCGECAAPLTRQPSDVRPIAYTPPHLVERILSEQAADGTTRRR